MANPSSTVELLDLVRRSGIVRSGVLEEKLRLVPSLPEDPGRCAAVLVREGLLTRFQAKLLLTGKYRGFRLGPYVIHDQIGQGGMGAVYLAEHETLRRKVAVKVLTPTTSDARLAIERFLREARAAAALDHPNIVRIFDVAAQDDTHYLVMEYVDGETLESVLEKAGAVPCGRAVAFVTQALAGLQHAYEKGFVHRDIKPANLMLTRDGTVKILDMGLARSFTSQSDKLTELMDQGAVVGTADYISPEQALNSPDVDIRSDIYSLGATFYALVTGSPPFTGNTTQKLMQHQMKEAPSLSDVDQTFPPGLAHIASKMMRKRPDDRYQTPGEVIAALAPWVPGAVTAKVVAGLTNTDIAGNAELQNTLTEMVTGSTRRLPRTAAEDEERVSWTERWPVIAAGIVAVLLVGVGALVYALNTPDLPILSGNQKGGTSPSPEPQAATPRGTIRPATSTSKTGKDQSSSAGLGRVVYRFNPATIPAFKNTKEGGRLVSGDREQLPQGVHLLGWKPETQAEFTRTDVDGLPVIGLTQFSGILSAQLAVELEKDDGSGATSGLADDQEYLVNVTYKTTGQGRGATYIQTQGDFKHVARLELPNTGGDWKTAELPFRKPARTVRLLVDLLASGDENSLWISEIVVAERRAVEATPAAPATAGPALFQFDTTGLRPFRFTVEDRRSVGERPRLPNVEMHCWRNESVAEFRGESTPGGFAIGVTNLNDALSGQILFQLARTATQPGREYVARIEYRTINDAAGHLMVRGVNYVGLGRVDLRSTAGQWRTVEVRFTRPEGQALDAVVENRVVGEGNTLFVRKFDLLELQ
jgi:serine/threonine protein kinase